MVIYTDLQIRRGAMKANQPPQGVMDGPLAPSRAWARALALVCHPGPFWVPVVPCGRALAGRALVGALGLCGPGPCGPSPCGPPGPLWAGPYWGGPSWARPLWALHV